MSSSNFLSGVTFSWWRDCKVAGEVGRWGVFGDAALLCNAGLWTAARPAPAWLQGGGD